MRISDWSSDVCSSDLSSFCSRKPATAPAPSTGSGGRARSAPWPPSRTTRDCGRAASRMRQRWTPSASTDTGQAVRSRSAGRARGGGQRDRETAMIRGYVNRGDRLQAVETALDRDDAFVWIDLISPTQDEEAESEEIG